MGHGALKAALSTPYQIFQASLDFVHTEVVKFFRLTQSFKCGESVPNSFGTFRPPTKIYLTSGLNTAQTRISVYQCLFIRLT